MKGIYFSQIKEQEVAQGAVLKVYDEISAFERAGLEMRHVNYPPIASGLRKTHIGKGICAAVPFTFVFSKYKYDPSYAEYDFYYFRFEVADYWFTKLLKQLRKHNPQAKILIEFPDYPNTTWMNSPLFFPVYLKDLVARHKYKTCVDRFVVLNPVFHEIYGVPTICYMNGIDVSRIPVRKPQPENIGTIEAIGIGTMFPVHGYERFIKSMAKYYEQGGMRNIVFHIVGKGPGPELKRYMEITKETGMSGHVVFEGQLVGDGLTACYDKCNLAIEQLALYRKAGLQRSSSLKSREYLARGIPIISGCDIDILLNRDFPYWLQFPNDDSLMDMEKIIYFFDSVYAKQTEAQVVQSIRMFAEENCSYDSTLRKVINYVLNS